MHPTWGLNTAWGSFKMRPHAGDALAVDPNLFFGILHKRTLDAYTLLSRMLGMISYMSSKSLIAQDKMKSKSSSTRNPRSQRQSIQFLTSSSNSELFWDAEIVDEFHNYYSKLYNLSHRGGAHASPPSQESMINYIREMALPTIFTSETEDLDLPFTEAEFLQAIKGLENGVQDWMALDPIFIKFLSTSGTDYVSGL